MSQQRLKSVISALGLSVYLMLLNSAAHAMPEHTEKKIIVINKAQSQRDASAPYYKALLTLVLSKTQAGQMYLLTSTEQSLTQARALAELERGQLIHVYPTATTPERESRLIAVPIPILKNTLGTRISLIHKDNIAKFDAISSLDDLRKYTACQGMHWPDSDILEHANLKVLRNANYDSMFSQLANKHCDYFPRSIFEAESEWRASRSKHPKLHLYQNLILAYQMPMYFFVSPKHPELAKSIHSGLKKSMRDGSFNQLFEAHFTGQRADFLNNKSLRIFELANPRHTMPQPTEQSRSNLGAMPS